ncbi:P-type conjugative transfer protein TrbL [Hyphomonas sp. FCG-A18]|uniref:P-type conjugative transfer protein TrbL n=1 Tax=Hyphomonas sp. FCG-A18 TaxID=3080019 RepID=UPI002B2D8048|nr:P-type conjugative transfer protein TrbL [Hyphomonas sp. FCG-A18]
MDVIDTFLDTFIRYIDSGFGLLAGDVAYLTTTLIAIDITLAGLFWALSQNNDVIASLLKKVLYVGFFAFIIGNFALLAGIVFDSFAELGIKAGGSTMTAADLLRPGYIASVGFEAAQPLLEEISDMLGPISFFHNFIMIAVMFVAWAIIMVAFFVLAVQLFITILEFKLTTLAGFVLVPFALWNKTSFLAERVLGNVITSGIKLMVLAVIIGIGSTLFGSVTEAFRTGDDVTLAQVMGTVLAAIVFFWMGIFAPGIASGLITGAPQLGAGSAAGAAAGAAAGTYMAGAGGRATIGAAASGASSAVKAGASMAGAARTSYTLGSVASGKSGPSGIAAGIAGVARAGGDAIARTAGKPMQSLKAAYSQGSQGAWQATGGSSSGDTPNPNEPPNQSPSWARRMQARQNISQAGQMAAHSLRDGDRGSSGAAPHLTDKDD